MTNNKTVTVIGADIAGSSAAHNPPFVVTA